MDSNRKDPARRTLDFSEEAATQQSINLCDDDESNELQVNQSNTEDEAIGTHVASMYKPATGDATASDLGEERNQNNCFEAFRSLPGIHHRGQTQLRTSAHPSHTDASANSEESTILHSNRTSVPFAHMETPKGSNIANPYSTGRTPLEDKDLWSSNDAYLLGVEGTSSTDEFESLYLTLNLPKNLFGNVRYAFVSRRDADDCELYIDDKQIKNLPKLRDLRPETFVDWYDEMENELMLITKITLMPFDAIVINWQYVGLCIPGVGERAYLAMAKVLWRICKRTLPHDEDAVQDSFKLSSGRVQDGFKIIWDVLVRSQPAFCPWKRYYEPQWSETRDVVSHSKRWTLFFRFMSKSEIGYSSDTKRSLFRNLHY
jgi:hypothetical protein